MAIIGVGFLMHTFGHAQAGIITSCLSRVGSATAFFLLLGWCSMFHLWYMYLAILLIAVPTRVTLKAILAGLIIILNRGMFFHFSNHDDHVNAPRSH